MFNECFLSNRSNCEYISHRVGRALVFFLPSVGFVSFFFFLKKKKQKTKKRPGKTFFSVSRVCVRVCFSFLLLYAFSQFPFRVHGGSSQQNQIKFSIENVALVIQMLLWGLLCDSNYSPLSGRSTG